jgi:hypothetical protein
LATILVKHTLFSGHFLSDIFFCNYQRRGFSISFTIPVFNREKYHGEPNNLTFCEQLRWLVNDNTVTEEVKGEIFVESILCNLKRDIFNQVNLNCYRNHSEKCLAFVKVVLGAEYIPPGVKIELLRRTPGIFGA